MGIVVLKKTMIYATVLEILYFALIYGVALLPQERLIGSQCLPPHLQDKGHQDYLIGKWIPRSATSACFVEPPVMLLGSQKSSSPAPNGESGPGPIPERGTWQFSSVRIKRGVPLFLGYFAITTENGWHFRFGCRWNDVDHYYTFPSVSLKKIK